MKTKFQSAFDFMKERCADDYAVYGDLLVVEQIPDLEEKTSSGIILNVVESKAADKPLFCRVLEVGQGFFDEETGKDAPLDVNVGDVILVPGMSVLFFSKFGPLLSSGQNKIGITRESEIRIKFSGQKGYDNVVQALKDGLAESGNR